MDNCELQTLGNVVVMILAAVFTGIRLSRCTVVKSICFTCERSVVNNNDNLDNVASLPL